jgi:hypothetical protein
MLSSELAGSQFVADNVWSLAIGSIVQVVA